MAKPDVTARLAALDAQLILAQQADRLGGLEQVRERGRAVPLALQTLAGHQPGRQRAVGLAVVELAEQTLERLAIRGAEAHRPHQGILGERLESSLDPLDGVEVLPGDDPVRARQRLLPLVELGADDLHQRQDAVLVLRAQRQDAVGDRLRDALGVAEAVLSREVTAGPGPAASRTSAA